MNQSNIDYLFQVTAAGALRPPGGSTRGSEPSPPFGDHFSRSSSAAPDQASRAGGQELPRQEPPPRSSAPASQDARQGASQEPSGGATDGQINNQDHGAAASDESNRADASWDTDPKSAAEPTETSALDEENSTDHEQSGELPDGAESATATGVSVAAVQTLRSGAELAETAHSAEQSTAGDTTSNGESTKEEAANHSSSTNAVRLATDESGVEQLPEEHASGVQPAGIADANKLSIRSKVGKSAGKKDFTATEASRSAGEQRNVETTARQAAGSELSPELEATVTGDGANGPDDELAALAPSEDSNASAEEPRRRTTSGTSSRTESTATQNAVVATVANKAAAQAGESSAIAEAADDATRPAAKSAASRSDALVTMLGRPHAGGSAAHRGPHAAGEDELPRVDPARFIGRVAKAFHTAQERGGTLQLRLSPPELGSIRLELTVKEGVMTAALETETAAARRVLLDHLPALRERLAEQNIRVERFDVDVRRDGGGSQADDRAAQHQQHNHQPDQPPPRRQPVNQSRIGEGPPPDTRTIPTRTNDTQINLVA